MEDDESSWDFCTLTCQFQSTSPVWRTTFGVLQIRDKNKYFNPPCGGRPCAVFLGFFGGNFNPRPPCGGRPGESVKAIDYDIISIHVPRVEDDPEKNHRALGRGHFNPRPPCGGRHDCVVMLGGKKNFNPRPPCGGRPKDERYSLSGCPFQSTSTVWRTTLTLTVNPIQMIISIHVPRVEDDEANTNI